MNSEIAYRMKAARFVKLADNAASMDERTHLLKLAEGWAELADVARDEMRATIQRHPLLKVVVLIAAVLLSGAAHAIECQSAAPSSNRSHWSWRLIDGKKCWYVGPPGIDKSKLSWAAMA